MRSICSYGINSRENKSTLILLLICKNLQSTFCEGIVCYVVPHGQQVVDVRWIAFAGWLYFPLESRTGAGGREVQTLDQHYGFLNVCTP